MRPSNGVLVVLVLLGLLLPSPLRAAGSAPVERVNAALLEVMREAEALGYRGRYEALAPVLSEAFNFEVMSRIAVGRHWKALNGDQRERLVEVFTQLSVATFAARFDGYGGERFQIRGTRPQRGSVVVDNLLVPPEGEAVAIDYVVREFDGAWRIVDVRYDDSYSQLAIRRAEFVALIDNDGFEGLIAALQDKVAAFAAGGQRAQN